jgi:hypothetical protein
VRACKNDTSVFSRDGSLGRGTSNSEEIPISADTRDEVVAMRHVAETHLDLNTDSRIVYQVESKYCIRPGNIDTSNTPSFSRSRGFDIGGKSTQPRLLDQREVQRWSRTRREQCSYHVRLKLKYVLLEIRGRGGRVCESYWTFAKT